MNDDEARKPLRKRTGRRPVGETIGGIIVGFDQQIMRTLPPPHELVLKGAPLRGLTGQDAQGLTIRFPDDPPSGDTPPSPAEVPEG